MRWQSTQNTAVYSKSCRSSSQGYLQVIKLTEPPYSSPWVPHFKASLQPPLFTYIQGTHVVFKRPRKVNTVWNKKYNEVHGYLGPLLLLSSSWQHPFLFSTLSYATLPAIPQTSWHIPTSLRIPVHPCNSLYIPVHPCAFPHILWQPANTELGMACLPKREQMKYSLQGFPSAWPSGNWLLTKAPCWPQEPNSGRRAGALPVAQTNTTYCNPLLPPVLIQHRPSWVTRHFEDLTFSHYLSFI